jgi:D-alanyl-D-alanine carboxypeptidase
MKNFLKISAVFIISIILSAYRADIAEGTINKSQLSKQSIIAVSIRDASSEKVIFQRDANLLLHPASTLKALTSAVILDSLGENYKVSTGFYKDPKNNLYLKLSGDPFLTTQKLTLLVKKLKEKGYKKINNELFIDDSAVDNNYWGIGWMWDDKDNPLMPKFNAYNLDRNLTAISGKLKPIANPELNFKNQLSKILKTNNIKFSGNYKKAKLPQESVIITEISHSLLEEVQVLNHKSDNLAAETLFKLAGKKGTTEGGLEKFNAFYSRLGLNPEDIYIVDASGVSHNDLLTANWTTHALAKLSKTKKFNIYKKTLASPSELGTLQNRLLNFRGKLFAKTGTNAGISSICGYYTDNSGKIYSFSIIIQNFIGDSAPAKKLEDDILKNFFN